MTKKPVPISPWRTMGRPPGLEARLRRPPAIQPRPTASRPCEQRRRREASRRLGPASRSCVPPVGSAAMLRRAAAGRQPARRPPEPARILARCRGPMAGREELVDALAVVRPLRRPGGPQLEGSATLFEEAIFARGERVLRQGLTGSGFYVVLEGEAASWSTGRSGRGSAAATSSGRCRSCSATRRSPTSWPSDPLRCLVLAGPQLERFLRGTRGSCTACCRPQARRLRAPLTAGGAEPRPFPPGEYPVVVVGSGPGALQLSHALDRLGIHHATLTADPSPGGMFRRLAVLPAPPVVDQAARAGDPAGRAGEWYDWNSLARDDPALRAIMPALMDGSSSFPSRPDMEENLVTFVARAGLQIRYDCPWLSTARRRPPTVDSCSRPRDGEYTCATRSSPSAWPSRGSRRRPALELRPHYVDAGPPRRTRGSASSSSASRTRASSSRRPPALGEAAGARVAVAGDALGRRAFAGGGPRPVRPAIRGRHAGQRRLHAGREDRADRAVRRRLPRAHAPDR